VDYSRSNRRILESQNGQSKRVSEGQRNIDRTDRNEKKHKNSHSDQTHREKERQERGHHRTKRMGGDVLSRTGNRGEEEFGPERLGSGGLKPSAWVNYSGGGGKMCYRRGCRDGVRLRKKKNREK